MHYIFYLYLIYVGTYIRQVKFSKIYFEEESYYAEIKQLP